jgi:hypothetical protein
VVRFTGKTSPTDATVVTSEGLVFANNVIANATILMHLGGVRYFNIIGNVLDYAGQAAIQLESNATYYSGAHVVVGNYMAVNGPGGTACVYNLNAVAPLNLDRYIGNTLVSYSGSAPYGFAMTGSQSQAIIANNSVTGFTSNDILIEASGARVINNDLTSATAFNLSYTSGTTFEAHGNSGTMVRYAGQIGGYETGPGGKRTATCTAVPTVGAWKVGDFVHNEAPAVGAPKGWFCTPRPRRPPRRASGAFRFGCTFSVRHQSRLQRPRHVRRRRRSDVGQVGLEPTT